MVFHLFSERLRELIRKKGFLEPTPPQRLGIPEILSGKNVLIISPTGVGKTEACILPLLDKIKINNEKPIALLYITPLRSLNRDLLDRLFWWTDNLELDIDVRHGDTSKRERSEQREYPSHILITTPETLNAILPGKRMREHLKNVKYVVIDEIHELVENKRGIQLSLILERLERIAGNFQRIALSATIGEPNKVAKFLGNNVKIINAEAEKNYDIKIELPKVKENEAGGRIIRIKELVNEHNKTLIFTNTRETAEILGSRFKLLEKDFPIDVHHGSLSKNLRIKAENAFKKGELKALIATSSLELGIDIGNIDFIIQYFSPRRVSKLLQRCGRGGHNIGEISKGVIISDKDDLLESCIIAKNANERKIEGIKIHELATDILATQIVGITLDEYEISLDDIFSTIKKAYPYRKIKKEDFVSLINFLSALSLIYISEDGKRVKRRKRGWGYYYENLSSIPDVKKLAIIEVSKNETIGFLDESFVLEYGEIGNTFICAGSAWKIIQIDGNKVYVEYIEDAESAIPAWEGELIPVSFEVAQDVGRLRNFIYKKIIEGEDKNLLKNFLIKNYNLNEHAAKSIIKTILMQKNFVIPDNETFFIESYKDFIIIHSCCGNLVNNTMGRYIASMIAMEKGESLNFKIDPYRIIIRTFLKPEDIAKIILNAKEIKKVIEISLEDSTLFKWNFFQIAKRFGIVSANATIDSINLNKIINQYREYPVYNETMRTILTEKMDIEKTEEILNKIRRGEIKLIVSNKGLSPLGKIGLERLFFDVIKPKKPEKEIFESFKRRLLKTRIRIVCMNCEDYSISLEVKDLEDYPTCPKCSSRLIGIYDHPFKNPLELLKKKNLTKDEKKEIERLRRSASLMITYGKKYAIAQAGRGIGVETAARILSKLPKDEETLLRYIFEAEKSYVKYRKYWKF